MKLFKNIDQKFYEIGFKKVTDDKFGVCYERDVKEFSYIQVIDILYKNSGRHLIQSYEKNVNKDGFNNVVGITKYEARLCVKKMNYLGL